MLLLVVCLSIPVSTNQVLTTAANSNTSEETANESVNQDESVIASPWVQDLKSQIGLCLYFLTYLSYIAADMFNRYGYQNVCFRLGDVGSRLKRELLSLMAICGFAAAQLMILAGAQRDVDKTFATLAGLLAFGLFFSLISLVCGDPKKNRHPARMTTMQKNKTWQKKRHCRRKKKKQNDNNLPNKKKTAMKTFEAPNVYLALTTTSLTECVVHFVVQVWLTWYLWNYLVQKGPLTDIKSTSKLILAILIPLCYGSQLSPMEKEIPVYFELIQAIYKNKAIEAATMVFGRVEVCLRCLMSILINEVVMCFLLFSLPLLLLRAESDVDFLSTICAFAFIVVLDDLNSEVKISFRPARERTSGKKVEPWSADMEQHLGFKLEQADGTAVKKEQFGLHPCFQQLEQADGTAVKKEQFGLEVQPEPADGTPDDKEHLRLELQPEPVLGTKEHLRPELQPEPVDGTPDDKEHLCPELQPELVDSTPDDKEHVCPELQPEPGDGTPDDKVLLRPEMQPELVDVIPDDKGHLCLELQPEPVDGTLDDKKHLCPELQPEGTADFLGSELHPEKKYGAPDDK